MKRSLTRTFSVPTAAVRAGNFAGFGADLRSADDSDDRRVHAVPEQPDSRRPHRPDRRGAARRTSRRRPRARTLQNLTSVEEQDRDLDQFSVRLDHQLTDADQLFARFSTFDADELQPFGTSALQETLVPGFGRSLTTKTRNLVASHTHVFGHVAAQRAALRLDDGRRRAAQRRIAATTFAQQVGLLGVTSDPRDMGFPQISTGGLYNTFGDPTIFTTRDNQHFELFDNVTLDRGAHRFKFGAYYFHLQLRPEQPDNARGAFTYTGQFTRQCVRRLPPRLPDVGGVGHRPRRRERADQLAAPLRAGRLAGARAT